MNKPTVLVIGPHADTLKQHDDEVDLDLSQLRTAIPQ